MEQTSVQKLARVLRVMVMAAFVCNLIALMFVPLAADWWGWERAAGWQPPLDGEESLPALWLRAVAYVWRQPGPLSLALFLAFCGVCTAVILWQGKRVLDTILMGEPFSPDNAGNLKRAAMCCFLIAGAALLRVVWGLVNYWNLYANVFEITPIVNALFVPIFLMGGLLFMVMSALFRQAAELKAENDLTI